MSYHHGADGGRDSFERSIRLEGKLRDEERAQLMQAADMCPVGRMLGLSADIRTNDKISGGRAARYEDDLSELQSRTSTPTSMPRDSLRAPLRCYVPCRVHRRAT